MRILAANSVVVEEVVIDGFSSTRISVETYRDTQIVVNSSGIRSKTLWINTFIVGAQFVSGEQLRINNKQLA